MWGRKQRTSTAGVVSGNREPVSPAALALIRLYWLKGLGLSWPVQFPCQVPSSLSHNLNIVSRKGASFRGKEIHKNYPASGVSCWLQWNRRHLGSNTSSISGLQLLKSQGYSQHLDKKLVTFLQGPKPPSQLLPPIPST